MRGGGCIGNGLTSRVVVASRGLWSRDGCEGASGALRSRVATVIRIRCVGPGGCGGRGLTSGVVQASRGSRGGCEGASGVLWSRRVEGRLLVGELLAS